MPRMEKILALGKNNSKHRLPVAGPRANFLSVLTLGFLGLFVVLILTLLISDLWYLILRGDDFPGLRVFFDKAGEAAILTWDILTSKQVGAAIEMSIITSLVTLALVMLFAVPIGYALSRYRFRGHALLNTMVDVPIVLPPIVLGLSLLAFFSTGIGVQIKDALHTAGWSVVSGIGIVLCQFLVSISYCIRAMKASFDSVDQRLEHVALSLGCSHWQAFRRVTLPLARNGLLAGGIMAWARAVGIFGPLVVFVGTAPRVQVLPTTMWLELSVGSIQVALAVALVTVTLAGAALVLVHWLIPTRRWT